MAQIKDIVWKQADFLYDMKWGSKIDSDFVDYVSHEARAGNFVWPHKIHRVLRHAIDAVNHVHGTQFSYEYGKSRLKLMEQRYKTFSWLIGLDNVNYVSSTNIVTATRETWKSVIQKDKFAKAYSTESEPKFEELAAIYSGYVDNLVLVSSDDDENKPHDGVNGNKFVLVDDDDGAIADDGPAFMDTDHEGPFNPSDSLAIVPYTAPEEPKPLAMIQPLDLVEISSGSSAQSSLFNWWERLEMMSDSEGSTADASTGHSFVFAESSRGGKFRSRASRYKNVSPIKPSIQLSSTASNSPFAKPPVK